MDDKTRKPTVKQTLLAHLLEHHSRVIQPSKRRPRCSRGKLENLTYQQLLQIHRAEHHRYASTLSHLHWDGTDEDRNLGISRRPKGWATGLDVQLINCR